MRRGSVPIVGCVLLASALACIHIDSFPNGGRDGGSGGSDGGGSVTAADDGSGGITVTGPFYVVHFGSNAGDYPDSIRLEDGANLVAPAPGGGSCLEVTGTGAALSPTFGTSIVGKGLSSATITWPGPAVVKIDLEWSHDTSCGSGGASATVDGHTEYTFFPDGQMIRWDDFTPGSDLETGSTCACDGGSNEAFAYAGFQSFVGTGDNVYDGAGQLGEGDNFTNGFVPGEDLCIDDPFEHAEIVFAFGGEDADTHAGEPHVHELVTGQLTFSTNLLPSNGSGSGSDRPPATLDTTQHDYVDAALRVVLVPPSQGSSCGTFAGALQNEQQSAADLTVTYDGDEQNHVGVADQDHVFGGRQGSQGSQGSSALTPSAGSPVVLAANDDFFLGLAVNISYKTAIDPASITVERSDGSDSSNGTKAFAVQDAGNHRDFQLWFAGPFTKFNAITIRSAAPN